MAHIMLPDGLPGISAAFAFRPETAAPLRELAHVLLRGPSPLSEAERELIATHVSRLNGCRFCAKSHGAAARHLLGTDPDTYLDAAGEKLHALLDVATRVQCDGRTVSTEIVDRARAAGASDIEIHDTVLIAAAFSMFNRYVDGLATWEPDDEGEYDSMGERLAATGYRSRPGEEMETTAPTGRATE